MEHKGYLTDDGRVVTTTRPATDPGHARAGMLLSLDGSYIVGELHHDVVHYNLRRAMVTRSWYVTPHPKGADTRLIKDRAVAVSTTTRREAIAAAMKVLG